MKITRYGNYWADLDPTRGSEIAKLRPVVVVSPDAMNRHFESRGRLSADVASRLALVRPGHLRVAGA